MSNNNSSMYDTLNWFSESNFYLKETSVTCIFKPSMVRHLFLHACFYLKYISTCLQLPLYEDYLAGSLLDSGGFGSKKIV